MKIKDGVLMAGLQPIMREVLIQADKIWQELGQELVVTSALDGEHSASSLHYFGYALDFRIRYFEENEQWQAWQRLAQRLEQHSTDYAVVKESTHIHVEYKPAFARINKDQ
jgi:hypothetical protein